MKKKIGYIFQCILLLSVLSFPKSESESILKMTEAEALFHLFVLLIFLPMSIIGLIFGISKRLRLRRNSKMIYIFGFAIILGIYKTMHPDRPEGINLIFKLSLLAVCAILLITFGNDKDMKKWLEKNESNNNK